MDNDEPIPDLRTYLQMFLDSDDEVPSSFINGDQVNGSTSVKRQLSFETIEEYVVEKMQPQEKTLEPPQKKLKGFGYQGQFEEFLNKPVTPAKQMALKSPGLTPGSPLLEEIVIVGSKTVEIVPVQQNYLDPETGIIEPEEQLALAEAKIVAPSTSKTPQKSPVEEKILRSASKSPAKTPAKPKKSLVEPKKVKKSPVQEPERRVTRSKSKKVEPLPLKSPKARKAKELSKQSAATNSIKPRKTKQIAEKASPSTSVEPQKEQPATSNSLKARKSKENVSTNEQKPKVVVKPLTPYQQFQQRTGPSAPGSKAIPKGKPGCLSGLSFLITGELTSQTRVECATLIQSLGGEIKSGVSKKLSYLIVGEDGPGPAKLAKAEEIGVPLLSEDEFLDLIREKSGKKV